MFKKGRLQAICWLSVSVALGSVALPAAAGNLSGSSANSPAQVDLEAEGTSDWAHWGLSTNTSFDHRSAGGGQISSFTVIGGANPTRASFTKAAYSWSDGVPTPAATSSRTGLRVFGVGKGFSISAPADAEPRTLTLYVGAYKAVGEITATLSDGSAIPYTTTVSKTSGKQSFAISIDYSSDLADQTLDIDYVVESLAAPSGSWISLESATLQSTTVSNLAPTIDSIEDVTVVEGETLTAALQAADPDGPAPIVLTNTNTLPGASPILTDNGDGSGSFDWQSEVGDAASSPYEVVIRATDGDQNFSEEIFAVNVIPASSGGSLVGNAQDAPFNTNLTTVGGADDWVHWGLQDATSVDRKASVAQQISNFTAFGGATPSRYTATDARYSWTDGSPNSAITQTRTGLRVFSEDRGFEFTIPLGTESKTLRVYVGVNRAVGEFTATLSDGSAVPYVEELSNASGKSSLLVTIQAAAGDEGQLLTLRYTLKSKLDPVTGWVSLESATLTGSSPINQAPTIASLADQTVIEGETFQLPVSAIDPDGPAPLDLSEVSDLPRPSDILTDNGDGTGLVAWTSQLGDAANSPYEVTVRATDGSGAFDERSFFVTVLPAVGGGSGLLDALNQFAPSSVSLTAIGTADWAHWGRTSASSVDRKVSGGGAISDFSPIDGATPVRGQNHVARYSWSDGSPGSSVTSTRTGLRVFNPNKGFALSVPADTQERVLHLYLGANRGVGEVQLSLSDGSAAPYVAELSSPSGKRTFLVSVSFAAANPGQTLNVEYTLKSETNAASAWASLESAALSIPDAFSLPYVETFDSSPATDWMIVDEATVSSDWGVSGSAYAQSNPMGLNGASMNGAAHLGTYSYLATGMSLTDYRVSVTARSTATSVQDIGLLARVNPAGSEYLRLSRSGANSFSRLERSALGSHLNLGVNSLGILPEQSMVLELVVDGNLVTASIDGQAVFAGYSEGPSSGTVGLYCRDACVFDDLEISELDSTPDIVIGMPAALTFRNTLSFVVSAVARNVPPGGAVVFDIPGETDACTTAVEVHSGYYESDCTVSDEGYYSVVAELLSDTAALLSNDSRTMVGVGQNYASIGDSITAGLDDRTLEDAAAANGTVIGIQGYQAMLTDLLEESGQFATVSNSGVPGDTSASIISERIDGVLERHENASHLLLTIGVNDAGGALFTPSGLGCVGSACDGTFAGNVQQIVDTAVAAGKTVVVAQTPPRFGDPFQVPHSNPESHPQNVLIRDEYNEVIANQITDILVGPNFYDLFLGEENRFYLYETNLHPNSLGYLAMAARFHQVIDGGGAEAFFATNLCLRLAEGGSCESPTPLRQTLLETGNRLFVDENITLAGSVPPELQGGRWIQSVNGNRNLENTDHLSFDLPELATVFVAYDAGATSVPVWLNSFTLTGETIETTDPTVPLMNLYRLNNQIGSVSLPAASATQNGAQLNYVVVLVEE